MRSHPGKQSRTFAPGVELLSEESRNQVLRQRGPGALDPFAAVIGIFSHHALAPALDTFAVHGDEKNPAMVEAMEAGLEKMDQRHMNFTQRDGFDFHGLLWPSLNHPGGRVSRRGQCLGFPPDSVLPWFRLRL